MCFLLSNTNQTPYYKLSVTIGYGEHCDDSFDYNTLEIIMTGDKTKHFDTWNYISQKDAEEIYKFFISILNKEECDHITLNDAWQLCTNHPDTFWYDEYMSSKEIKKFTEFYKKYDSLFMSHIEHNWYGITGIHIYYYDENGMEHECEVK